MERKWVNKPKAKPEVKPVEKEIFITSSYDEAFSLQRRRVPLQSVKENKDGTKTYGFVISEKEAKEILASE